MSPLKNIQITCPHCQERYMVEAGKLPPSGGRFTCRICGEKLEIRTELLAPQPAVVESRGEVCCPRCGNRFLPQQPAEGDFRVDSRRQETGRSREAGGQMKTILVVEDTEFFLELTKEVLGHRYRTLAARSSAEAIDILMNERVDLLMLDLSLQGEGDGLSVLQAFPRKPCPVLIFTSKQDQDLFGSAWEELRRAGADDLLLKGMNVQEEMLEKVAQLLSASNVCA
ncbi:MAG: hypothetical protein DMF49_01935 [Acidobacteria bacterium]|nr:MAG: hypothetical protein DMF49_01935 [Acidobacteriota bacterium]